MKVYNRFLARPEQTPGNPIRGAPEQGEILVSSFTAGMNTEEDTTDIKDDELVLAKNIRISDGKLERKPGQSSITPAPPDTLAVRKFVSVKSYSGNVIQYRFSDTKIHQRGTTGWTEIPNGGAFPLVKAANNLIAYETEAIFSTDGTTPIQTIDLNTGTYFRLGNAPRYKYITSFDNRIFGANLVDSGGNIPIQVGWTGTFDPLEWEPNVNFEAGFVPLEESQSDYADFITGIFGFASQLLVMRERSIWLASRTGSVTAPFFFYTAVPYVGCDTPASIQKVPNGVIWYDRRTNGVYFYEIGQTAPVSIGRSVENDILASVGVPENITSSFDSVKLVYRLAIPVPNTAITRVWCYNLRSPSWWIEEYENLTCLSSVDFALPGLAIQDLAGTIQDLEGTIENLSGNITPQPLNFYGYVNGVITEDDDTVSTGYDSEIISKTWVSPNYSDLSVRRMTFTYEVETDGEFRIFISKDNGVTYTLWKTVTLNDLDAGRRLITVCAKPIRTRQISWKIESSSGLFSLLEFRALLEPAGYPR